MSFPRYENYKDSGVEWLGEVPEHWDLKRIRYLIRQSYDGMKIGPFGSQLTSQMLDTSGYKVFGQENVIANDFTRGERFISDEKFQELNVYEIKPGDILITMMGTSGRCAIAPDNITTGIMDSHLLRMRVTDDIWPRFLQLLIDESAYVAHQIRVLGKGSIMHGLNSSIIKELLITVPPVMEQNYLLSFLDRETAKIDALIAEQKNLIELLKEKRQAVISHAVTKGLNPDVPMKDSGIEWLGEVPEHWIMKRLKNISPFIAVGIVVNPSEYVTEIGLPFIYGGDISEGKINTQSCRRISDTDSHKNAKTCLEVGDLLTVRVGAPGITAVVTEECEGGNCASVMLVRKGNFESYWLCYAMNSRMVRFQVEVVQYGAAQEQFNISHAINFWIATPPLGEQKTITAFLDRETIKIDELTTEAQTVITLLQERRTALISAAVTGKIDVRGLVSFA